jgi:hypothetical protein
LKARGITYARSRIWVLSTKEKKIQKRKTFEEHCKTQKMNKCIKRPVKRVILKCAHTRKDDR